MEEVRWGRGKVLPYPTKAFIEEDIERSKPKTGDDDMLTNAKIFEITAIA
jgi:hypothetical protein